MQYNGLSTVNDSDVFCAIFSQANLNFNPAAMLPGAAPPTKEPEPISIGFDVPAEARTLQSANKVTIEQNFSY